MITWGNAMADIKCTKQSRKPAGIARNNPGPFKAKRRPGRPRGSKKPRINLTEKEQLFANMILENMHKTKKTKMTNTECYRIAYQNFNAKDNSAQVMASNILTKPSIQQYMQERKREAANKVEITIARVLTGLLRIAEFDPRKLLTNKGKPIPIHKLDDDIALGMGGMNFKRDLTRTKSGRRKTVYYPSKVKHEARKPAWELLGTHLNMWDGDTTGESAQEFVSSIREFTDSIMQGIPGGQI